MKPNLSQSRQFLVAHLPRNAPGLAVGWLLAIIAVLLVATWLTRLVAPRPVASLAESPATAAPLALEPIYRLFGVAAGAVAQTGDIILTGVFAASDGKGFATFRLPQGQVAALEGREVMPGVSLLRVERDHVLLRTAAGEQRLQLIKEPAAAPVAREDQ
jgi:hypothetical protein